MPESVLVSKAERYLKEIADDPITLEGIENLKDFEYLYFKLDDRLNYLQSLKDDMDAQGYTTPFTSLNKYGTKSVAEVSLDEIGENSRHNQIFRMKANAKKNILDRVKSAIDSHKIALGNLEQFGYVKCNSCYKKYSFDEYKKNKGQCSCKSKSFTFKVRNEATFRLEIIPYLPLSGDYMVLMSELSQYGRESLKQVLNILKQERKGVVKTISLVIRYRDENKRLIRKNITLENEFVNKIKDDILKRNLTDFKRINKYDEILKEFENQTPDFIDKYDRDAIEDWRKSQIESKFRNLNYIDRFGNMTRSLRRDLKVRESIYKNTFKNIAPALILWDMFKYYMTNSYNSRKITNGPFPYIRVELDREQRNVFQTTYGKVIDILNSFTDLKIISIPEKDLLLYEKFKFEKQMRNSNIKFNHVALGAGLVCQNSDIELEKISNAFNINESRIKKEIKNINQIKNPRSDKSKQFLDLIKK